MSPYNAIMPLRSQTPAVTGQARRISPIARRLTDHDMTQALSAHRRMSDFLRSLGWALIKGELKVEKSTGQIVFAAESAGAARDLFEQLEAVKAIVAIEGES